MNRQERGAMSCTKHLDNTLSEDGVDWIPRTPFGRILLSLRKKAAAAGISLLTEEEVLEEVRNRRSGGKSHGYKKDTGGSNV